MTAEALAGAARETTARKYAFIDALRGYAVLLVITCHTGSAFPELPYPARRVMEFGWHGVQLFFLVSCVTLMMSWRSEERRGQASVRAFWLRRFFRIAPMYYLAAAGYFLLSPPKSGFDLWQLAASFGFVNAWHPLLLPTVPTRWMVVPGGWSIGVEFTFYAAFPLIAVLVTSLRRALVFFVIALAIGCVANTIAAPGFIASYGRVDAENFLYFWFPNQLPIFALGTVLYQLLQRLRRPEAARVAALLERRGRLLAGVLLVALFGLANTHLPQRLSLMPPVLTPTLLLASLVFMGMTLVLAVNPRHPLVNRPICALGEVSFSAYLLHFAVLDTLPVWAPSVFDLSATRYHAVAACAALWLATVPLTFLCASLTYRWVEVPMINFGRHLVSRRAPAEAAADGLAEVASPSSSGP